MRKVSILFTLLIVSILLPVIVTAGDLCGPISDIGTMNQTPNMTGNMTMNQTINMTANMTAGPIGPTGPIGPIGPQGIPGLDNMTMNMTANMTMNMTALNLNDYYTNDTSKSFFGTDLKRNVDNSYLALFGGSGGGGSGGIFAAWGKNNANLQSAEVFVPDATGTGNIRVTSWNGSTFPHMDMQGYNITGIRTITNASDAVNKSWAENLVWNNATLSSTINTTYDTVANVSSYVIAVNDSMRANVSSQDLLLLPLSGSRSMTGILNMAGYNITGIKTVANATDAANKSYVDAAVAGSSGGDTTQFLFLNGTRAMLGNLNVGSKQISSLISGTTGDTATNKTYVDSVNSTMKNYVDMGMLWVGWTPTLTWTGTAPPSLVKECRYAQSGKTVFFVVRLLGSETNTVDTVSNLSISLPVTPVNSNNATILTGLHRYYVGSYQFENPYPYITTANNKINFFVWTKSTSATKLIWVFVEGFYEVGDGGGGKSMDENPTKEPTFEPTIEPTIEPIEGEPL